MIKNKLKFTEATCDACKSDLLKKFGPTGEMYPQYGQLSSHFGYEHRFDSIDTRRIEICDLCWEKALKAIGLDPMDYTG